MSECKCKCKCKCKVVLKNGNNKGTVCGRKKPCQYHKNIKKKVVSKKAERVKIRVSTPKNPIIVKF